MKKAGNLFAFAVVAALATSGCTVQPLYAPTSGAGAGKSLSTASLYFTPVNNRIGIEIRNQLIFHINGGASQPADPAYEVTLSTSYSARSSLTVQSATPGADGEPTAQKVTVTANYTLKDTETGKKLSSRRAIATASYDVSQQQFANQRAELDAQNRAAASVAEQLRALIAADLARHGAI
jgi:LPS-assembly lipoprotein